MDNNIEERTRSERQQRYFKSKAIKFNRKLNRMGASVLEPNNFSNMMVEGNALLLFMSIDCLNEEDK